MSGTIDPPILVSSKINRYTYTVNDLIPHTSILYFINCFNDDIYVKSINGILEGEQYKEWTTDDWLDRFIKQKIEELPNAPEPKSLIPHEPIVSLEPLEPLPDVPSFTDPLAKIAELEAQLEALKAS